MPHGADCEMRADYEHTNGVMDQLVDWMRELIEEVKKDGGDEVDVYEAVIDIVHDRMVSDLNEGAIGRPIRAIAIMLIRLCANRTVVTETQVLYQSTVEAVNVVDLFEPRSNNA